MVNVPWCHHCDAPECGAAMQNCDSGRVVIAARKRNRWIGSDMKVPVTKDYLEQLRQRLIDAEENGDDADVPRDEYRIACAWAYSEGDLVFGDVEIARARSAIRTLEQMGYTNEGGELWKPPLGQKPDGK